MSMLQIYLLGEPRICWANCPVESLKGRSQALLFRLAEGCEPISRQHLGFLFWPSQPAATVKRRVTKLCNHLQRSLPISNALTIGGDTVGLNRSLVWSDALLFRQLAEDYNRTPRLALLCALVDLYKGPLLDGYVLNGCTEYSRWIKQARRLWERDYLAALGVLVEQSMAQGDFQQAIAMARRYLAVNPTHETMHRHLIELHGICGDCSAAQEQYEICAELLRRERGRDPAELTSMAYRFAMTNDVDYRRIALSFEPHLDFADRRQRRRQWQDEPKPRRQKILLF